MESVFNVKLSVKLCVAILRVILLVNVLTNMLGLLIRNSSTENLALKYVWLNHITIINNNDDECVGEICRTLSL